MSLNHISEGLETLKEIARLESEIRKQPKCEFRESLISNLDSIKGSSMDNICPSRGELCNLQTDDLQEISLKSLELVVGWLVEHRSDIDTFCVKSGRDRYTDKSLVDLMDNAQTIKLYLSKLRSFERVE